MKRCAGGGAALLLGACLLSCSSSVNRAALQGDLPTLKREIARSQEQGHLGRARVERLAWSVAGRELRSTAGELAVRRIAQLRPCADHLTRVLRDRADRMDDAGAAAATMLLDTGQLRPGPLVVRYHDAASGAWRAVAARAAIAPEHYLLRRQLLVDPDERVRRNALHAAWVSPSADDRDALLEAARLDPDLSSRSLALRAVGGVGGESVVFALMDRWARAHEPERIAIIDAWATAASYASGGRERLIWVVETTRGMPAVAAASALARQSEAVRTLGIVTLTRAVQSGTTEERRAAIREVPLDDADARQVVEDAAGDPDRQVRVLALARLLETAPRQETFREPLRTLAAGSDHVAYQARAALAAAQDESVQRTLVTELAAPRAYRRMLAAQGLLALGDYELVATVLGDDDPRVRAVVACRVLAQAELPPR